MSLLPGRGKWRAAAPDPAGEARRGRSSGQNPYTVKVNVVLPEVPLASVAVALTVNVPAAVGVPVTAPAALIFRPGGRPVAEKATEPPSLAVALSCKGWNSGYPLNAHWSPGLVTVTVPVGGLPTVHLKLVLPEAWVSSVAVTVTDDTPAVVAVPEMTPVPESIDSPAGRPLAE